MKTFSLKASEIKRDWYIIDANNQPLGRIASKAAFVLMGKHKPTYTQHLDNGDYVIIINAEKILLTGRKAKNMKYYHYSGYVGGLREVPFKDMLAKKPLFPLEKAIKGMLPKNHLARDMYKKLYLFEGPEHNLKNKELKPLEI